MAPKRGIAESNVSTPSWPERSVADPHDPTLFFSSYCMVVGLFFYGIQLQLLFKWKQAKPSNLMSSNTSERFSINSTSTETATSPSKYPIHQIGTGQSHEDSGHEPHHGINYHNYQRVRPRRRRSHRLLLVQADLPRVPLPPLRRRPLPTEK